jgi:hypothetical protein
MELPVEYYYWILFMFQDYDVLKSDASSFGRYAVKFWEKTVLPSYEQVLLCLEVGCISCLHNNLTQL